LGKLKLKMQLLKPLSRPYLLLCVAVGEEAAVEVLVVEVLVVGSWSWWWRWWSIRTCFCCT
jgi:hypothetical protein